MATQFTLDETYQHQYDLFWSAMDQNPLLTYSSVTTLNKQLATNAKSIIKAMNELVTTLSTNTNTVGNFSNVFNSNVGNPDLDTADWTNLHKIDTNVIKSIYKVYTSLGQLSNLTTTAKGDLVSALNEVKAAVGTGSGTTPTVIDGGTF
jgi:hypothetical protein